VRNQNPDDRIERDIRGAERERHDGYGDQHRDAEQQARPERPAESPQ